MKNKVFLMTMCLIILGLLTACVPGGGCGDSDDPVPTPTPTSTPTPTPSPDDPLPPTGSTGCGKRTFPPSGTYTMDVNGTPREYIVALPDNYDPTKPYRLVFAWHYMGGSADGIARSGYYGLKGLSNNNAIFVAGQGLSSSGTTGWPNTGGRDVAFARAMYEDLSDNYCVDESRVFAMGMSYGGIMSNTVGCAMGDVFRAIAPIAGMGPGYSSFGAQCTGEVAAWIAHGNQDSVIPFSSGQASRDFWAEENGCTAQTSPTSPSPCVAYEGCDDGYPVHWCEFDGGHTIPSFASQAIWQFFMQF